MLALAFLVLIGVALVADGFEVHMPRGYIYFAMAFAAAVEVFNVWRAATAGAAVPWSEAVKHDEGVNVEPTCRSHHRRGPRHRRGHGRSSRPARGFDVAVNYKSDARSANAVIDAVKAQGRAGLAIQGDMGVEADIARMFETVDETLGPLTHFVYNCGITGRASRLEDVHRRDHAGGGGGQRARRLDCAAPRDPAHVEEARRGGRRDRADLVDGRDAGRAERIRLVRRLQRRHRLR